MERLIDYFKPESYYLDLKIDRQKELIEGEVRIRGFVRAEHIKFHAVGLNIVSVTYLPSEQTSTMSPAPIPCDFSHDGQILSIPVNVKMAPYFYQSRSYKEHEYRHENPEFINGHEDQTAIIIKFTSRLKHNMQGCYLSTYKIGDVEKYLVATQFESHYARECFPCIDEPAAKATFSLELEIADLSSEDVVISNMPLSTHYNNRFYFEPTPKMSTYLLAWVVGPLKSVSTVSSNGIRVTSYAALSQSSESLIFANETAAKALDYFDEKFGTKYPLPKLDQVALPDFEAGAMENWGLVTYRESCLLADKTASLDTKQSVAITVTHELSHQWFGNLVTMQWWDDLWLNESFATIMEYYATDALYPEYKIWQDFFTGDCVAALRRDALPGVQAVKQAVHDPAEIATLFDSAIVYAKGARLMLMLIRLMGEQNFYQGIRSYFEKYAYRNTVGNDLWSALQPYADFDIRNFMHVWISQPGYPALQLCHNGEYTWWEQQRLLINGTTDDSKWPLPDVKDDMSGHYLLELSDAEFQKKLDKFDTLNMEQRLRILIDRMLLAKARAVESASLLEILPNFVNENVAVWDILLSIINDLKVFFAHGSPEEDLYQKFLRELTHERTRAVGMLSKANDSSNEKRLRKILAVVARFAHDDEIVQELALQYQKDMAKIDAEMRGNILMAKMMLAEDTIFTELLEKYQSETDPETKDDILGALASVRNEGNIQQVMELLKQPEIVRPQDHLYLYIYLLRNPKTRRQALSWLYDNWDYVEKLTGEKSLEDYPRCMANYIDTRSEADEFYEFFKPYKENPILKRTLAITKVSIESKLNLIEQESATVFDKLQTLIDESV